jgi:phosphate transport system ATP-binding protein
VTSPDSGATTLAPAADTQPLATSIPAAPPRGRGSTLVAESVSAWFGTHKVLDRVDLVMAANSVTALIGPSGCGKSTFLRILNRMHELVPSAQLAGQVLLDGEDIYDAARRPIETRRRVGMVFQKPNPFPAMSIYDNVVAGLKLTGVRNVDKDVIVQRSLTRAGLWNEVRNRLRQPGGALSGGQQQRLCIARAVAVKPEILLLDEPCSALDPLSTQRIEELIAELKSDYTIAIVTHNMQQAARSSDYTAFMYLGQLIEFDETEAIFTHPKERQTEDYITGRFG